MKLKTLWVNYGDDMMPNLVLAVDEYLNDENPSYWIEHFEKETKGAEEAGYTWRVIELTIPEGAVLGAFSVPQVRADVQ